MRTKKFPSLGLVFVGCLRTPIATFRIRRAPDVANSSFWRTEFALNGPMICRTTRTTGDQLRSRARGEHDCVPKRIDMTARTT